MRLQRFSRSGSAGRLAILLGSVWFGLSGCSHTRPYIGPDVVVCPEPCAPEEAVQARLILIGDTGEVEHPDEPIMRALVQAAVRLPEKTAVVFLGDNVYPDGIPAPEKSAAYARARRRLQAQLTVLDSSGARGVFVPGNHDWDSSGPDGWHAVRRQAELVRTLSRQSVVLPEDGCPGPAVLDVQGLRLVALDTEWWLRKLEKPVGPCLQALGANAPNGEDSTAVLERVVLEKLRQAVHESPGPVVVAAHHPPASHGPHGGFYDWKDYLFPLTNLKSYLWIPAPVLLGGPVWAVGELTGGWGVEPALVAGAAAVFAYPFLRRHVVKHDQDVFGPGNREMMRRMRGALQPANTEEKLVLFAAGHDHSLQVLEGQAVDLVLLSGAGSKSNKVGHGDDTWFAHAGLGFMQVDLLHDGRVLLRVLEPSNRGGEAEVVFSVWLR